MNKQAFLNNSIKITETNSHAIIAETSALMKEEKIAKNVNQFDICNNSETAIH